MLSLLDDLSVKKDSSKKAVNTDFSAFTAFFTLLCLFKLFPVFFKEFEINPRIF